MAAVAITNDDLAPFAVIDDAKAEAMIADALAMAALVAPCILDADFEYEAAAKAIIRGAILRCNDAGSGAAQTVTSGPFGQTVDTRAQRRGMFWPSEIQDLQRLCVDAGAAVTAFSVDTAGTSLAIHAETCTLVFGALYCSCGADLTLAFPLYEV